MSKCIVERTYISQDGEPQYTGKILLKHYNTPEKVKHLTAFPNIASFGKSSGEMYFYDEKSSDRDKKEPVPPANYDWDAFCSEKKLEEILFTEQEEISYYYEYFQEEWWVTHLIGLGVGKTRKLAEVIKEIDLERGG